MLLGIAERPLEFCVHSQSGKCQDAPSRGPDSFGIARVVLIFFILGLWAGGARTLICFDNRGETVWMGK